MTYQWRSSKRRGPRGAFTLVELLAVILIVGLIAATVAFRMTGLTHKARFEWGVGQLVNLDAALRSHAKNHGRTSKLEFELGTGQVKRAYGKTNADVKTELLGSNLAIRRFVSQSRDTTSGRPTVEYSPEGTSSTYAVELIYAGNAKQPIWLVFVGATGRVERLEEEREVIRLVKTVAASGNDSR